MDVACQISPKAKLGANVEIGEYTIVFDNVEIGDNSIIESHCSIGNPSESASKTPLIIGPDSHIRSHSVFYEGSTFGAGLITGHQVVVREDVVSGPGLQIGTKSIVLAQSQIGEQVKIHTLVMISEGTVIGDFVYILPYVQFLNDPLPPSPMLEGITVKNLAVISAGAIIFPGITIGEGSFIAAGSQVKKNVADIHCVAGNPAVLFCTLDKFVHPKYGRYHPWIKRHIAKYPVAVHPKIDEGVAGLDRLIKVHRSEI